MIRVEDQAIDDSSGGQPIAGCRPGIAIICADDYAMMRCTGIDGMGRRCIKSKRGVAISRQSGSGGADGIPVLRRICADKDAFSGGDVEFFPGGIERESIKRVGQGQASTTRYPVLPTVGSHKNAVLCIASVEDLHILEIDIKGPDVLVL